MPSYILVLNSGSSSVKFTLFECTQQQTLTSSLSGIVEEIGNAEKGRIKYTVNGSAQSLTTPVPDHRQAMVFIFDTLNQQGINAQDILAVGHRVVHGGDRYTASVLIDAQVVETIRGLSPIAPLHNPPNLTGIEVSLELLPEVPQVAVFDTAFHGTMPEYAYRYAIPSHWYEHYGVRKYGFHGTSHMYVARRAARLLDKPFASLNAITAHLGNGSSLAKIQGGRSVDTSMGFTPLEGVVMGTRSGDIDPALIEHVARRLAQEQNLPLGDAFEQVCLALNKESGLKALAGTNMMQDIRQEAQKGDSQKQLALELYAYRVAKYIGQYWATLPHTDAIIFTAGLGENESLVRHKILDQLKPLGIQVDAAQNQIRKEEVVIGTSTLIPGHPLSVLVIPTDEEIVIGYDTLYLGHFKKPVPQTYPFER